MKKIHLAIALLCFTSCERSSEPVAEVAKPAVATDFPKFSQKYYEGDSEMGGSGSLTLGDNSKLLAALEHRYRSTREIANPDHKSSFAVEKSSTESLDVKISKKDASGAQDLVAVWTIPKTEGGQTFSVSKISEPLKDDEQALVLLKSYTSLNEAFQTAVEWKSPKDR